MTDDPYQGYNNRETWAFNLHWANDYGLYCHTLHTAAEHLREHPDASDRELGQALIDHWREQAHDDNGPTPPALTAMDREVGSWWRVDALEVGRSVRESLDNES